MIDNISAAVIVDEGFVGQRAGVHPSNTTDPKEWVSLKALEERFPQIKGTLDALRKTPAVSKVCGKHVKYENREPAEAVIMQKMAEILGPGLTAEVELDLKQAKFSSIF